MSSQQKTLPFPWTFALIAVGLAGVIAGFIGLMSKYPPNGCIKVVVDNVWQSLALLLMQVAPDRQDVDNWWLVMGRVLAPAATIGFAYEFLSLIARRSWQAWRLRRLCGHVIIVGSGHHRDGCLRGCTGRVVVVSRGGGEPVAPAGIDLHALTAEAIDVRVLRRTRVDRARVVVLAGLDNDENLLILERIVECRRDEAALLRVLLRIDNPTLARQLNRDDGFVRRTTDAGGTVEVLPFDPDVVAARLLFEQHPLVDLARLRGQKRIHVVIAGWTNLTLAVLEQLARLAPFDDFSTPRVDVLAADVARVRAELAAVSPALLASLDTAANGTDAKTVRGAPAVLDLHLHPLDNSLGVPTPAQMEAIEAGPEPTVSGIVVTFGAGDRSAAAALAIRERGQITGRWRAPIFVEAKADTALGIAISDVANDANPADRITGIGALADVYRLQNLLEREDRAKRLHDAYLETVRRPRSNVGSDASAAPWPDLPQTFRETSRRAVDHLPIKVLSAGFVPAIRPERLEPGNAFAGTREGLESLAALEHRSWEIDRLLDGWRHGTVRDNQRRLHPAIGVSYERLDEELGRPLREFDRQQIAAAARMLVSDGRSTIKRELTIGLIGHNFVSADDRARIVATIERLRPVLVEPHRGRFVSLITPLAPGADLILAESMTRLLGETVEHRVVPVRTLPLSCVVQRFLPYLERGGQWTTMPTSPNLRVGAGVIERHIAAFLDSNPLNVVADLQPVGSHAGTWREEEARQHAFRRANAYIAQRCDVVVAFEVPLRTGSIGGTAEALHWCRDRSAIPTVLRQPQVMKADLELIVI